MAGGTEKASIIMKFPRSCWAPRCGVLTECTRPEDFTMDMGALTLIGVSHLFYEQTCVAGQTCAIDGLLGQHLTDDDQV